MEEKTYNFVVIEGYSAENEPRRTVGFDDLHAACRYVLKARDEIMEDYSLVIDRPGEIGWYEGNKLRYCAIRKGA